MACYHPSAVSVERKLRGGRRRPDTVIVPCGSCLGCRQDQARGWAVRLMHEAEMQPGAFFATLTYSEVPDNGSLRPDDLTRFIKRLRKRFDSKIRYFACGEYGEKAGRPHYHSVFLGPTFLDRDFWTVRNGSPVWRSEILESTWGLGHCELTGLNFAAARYVASYVRKKVKKRYQPDAYTRVDSETGEVHDVVPEFARMSRRPGIGSSWIEKNWRDVYPRDYVVLEGRQMKPPRYYDKRMEVLAPEVMEEVRYKRWLESEDVPDEKLVKSEKVHQAKVHFFEGRMVE